MKQYPRPDPLFNMKSLKDLKKIKIAPKQKVEPQPVLEKKQEHNPPQDEENLFLRAMQGVNPMTGKGREITPEKSHKPVKPSNDDQEAIETLNKLVNGQLKFDIEFSDEYIQGYVQGINSKTFRKFKAGKISIQGHLDLHGLNTLQAKLRLLNFMREQYINSKKCVLIIPGRGKNSPLGTPVLRNEVQIWLTQEPLKRIVLAFCSAQP
ncbi:MAG: Smr/MutS family protein, partial [Desulfovibrionales bacterium]|nr:Smr/MutS family protein [Desulfovibrionales bacterium]